ncbi:retention module-containing protein [Vibrio fluminensis]|uniref:retention module-containing protein n=1 Tax=Vibrio fluminensis TaxID=2783614 RepID=UPI0018896AB9|nr:retention module-containing protein [Vibrio fluminensis]
MNEQTVSVPGTIQDVVGTPIVVRPGEAAVGASKGFELKPNDLLFTPAGSELVVAINNELFLVDENCVGCINIASNQQPQLTVANINGELVTIDEPTDEVLDVNAIQEAILAGEDPTEILESTEAGESPDGSAIGTSATVPLNLAQTIAATKFETAGLNNQREQFEYEDGNDVVAAKGGLIINTTVTEGNLSDGTYPQQTITQATVTAGTLSLDPSSFVPVTSSLSALLNELNSEITSSGKAVEFIYDSTTNAIIGSQGDEKVLTIDIDALQSGKDILLRLTTTLEKPIDHEIENGSQGLVQFSDNLLQVSLTLTGADTNGNPLKQPLSITVSVEDGDEQLAVEVDESYTEAVTLSEDNPYQTSGTVFELGADELEVVRFDANAIDQFDGVLSDNQETEATLSEDGKTLTLTIKDAPDAVILAIVLSEDGTYAITQNLPLEQNNDQDTLNFAIPVTSIDYDGDVVTNVINYQVVDGAAPTVELPNSIEPVLESQLDSGNPVLSQGMLGYQGSDAVQHFEIDVEAFNSQYQGLLQSGELDITLVDTTQDDGSFIHSYAGKDEDGGTVFTITLQPDGSYTFELLKPLDHSGPNDPSSADNNLYHLDFPIYAVDSDEDKSDSDSALDGAQATTLTIAVVDDVSTLKESILFDQVVEPTIGVDGIVTATQNIFSDVSQDGDQVTHFVYSNQNYNLDDYTPNAQGVYAVALNPVGDDDTGIGTVYITRDGDISFQPNSDILHTDDTSINDILTANLEVFTKDGDDDVDSVDVTLKIKDGDNISFVGELELSFTETQNPQTFTLDNDGHPLDIGVQVGSDNIVSLDFVSDENSDSVLNSITVDEAQTYVHIIDDGQSIVVSLTNDPNDQTGYVLQATLSEDAQGIRSGEYTVIQHQAFDQVDDVLTIEFPFAAEDSDGDITRDTIDVTVNDGADITVCNPNCFVKLRETKRLDGSEENAITRYASVELKQGSDEIDTVVWQVSAEMEAALAALTTQGQDTQYQITDGLIRVFTQDEHGNQQDVIAFELQGDKSGDYTVTQYLPIDNDMSDNKDIFEFSIVATDADGDSVVADIDVILKDGANTKLSDSALSYTEKEHKFGNAKNGSVQLKAGSDGVSEVSVTLDNEAEVMDWTSQDQALDIVKSGNDYTLVYESDPDNKVLEFIFDSTTGNYQVIQHKPIDQDVSNLSKLEFTVTATSTDDANVQASIDVTIKDGVETRLSNSTIQYTEKQTGIDPDVSYGFKTGSVNIKAGVDGVSEVEVSIDDSDALSSWTSQGKPLELLENGNDFKLVYADDLNQTVIEFNFDDETGDYSVEQFLPIDQIGAEQSVINLTVDAFSTDDEKSSATIAITIKDGAETSLKNRTVTLTEKDDGDNQFIKGEVSGDVNLKPGVDGVSAVALTLSQAQINDINANWTSQGKALAVVEDLDSNTYSVVYKDDPTAQVLKVVLDDEGNYKVEQSLPIDQQGSTSSLVFDVTASSTDDANISKTLTVNIKDGVDTSLKNDQVTLEESVDGDGEFATKSVSGDVKLNPGPDGAESSISLNNQDDVSKWTSNGNPLKLVATDDTITLLDEDNNKVLELIYYPEAVGNKVAGSYDVIQYAAIDQPNSNVSTMLVDVTATSTDDNPITKQITVNIKDGVTPSIDINGSASLTETTDMDVATPAKKTFTQLLDIHSGTDDIDTVLFTLADNSPLKLDDLTSEGRELEVKSEDGSYSLFIKGSTTEVLNITLDKQSGDVTVEQYRPLDNPSDNHIELKIVATAKDTDGDSASNSFNLTLVDGQDPQIKPDSSVEVYEKGLGESDDHTESNSVSVEFEASSDNIKTIEIKPTGIIITDQNDAPVTLTADKQAVQFEQTSNGLIGFFGSGDSKETVFEATVNSDYTSNDFGKVTFTLLKEVDHPNAGTDALVLKLPVVATDFDGDTSQTGAQQAYVTVNLIDDVSTLKASILFDDITEPTLGTQGSTTEVKNIFADVSKDGDQVTHIVYDNKSYDLDDYTPDGQGVYAIALDAKGADDNGIGTVYITRDGDISFKPNSDILHTDATSSLDVLTAKLEVHTKDGDNDVDSVDVTLKIKDGKDIGFAGELDVAWTEVNAIKTITTDSEGEILNVGLTSGSDHLASLKFVADSDSGSVLNNITVDEAETFVHIINGGDSIVVSTNQNQPLNVADYILQATLSKDAQGNANGEYSITQYKPFDQAQLPIDAAVILLPLVATDTDGDPTAAEIKLTVTDGQDITVGNSTSSVQLNETLTLDGTEGNAISQHDSVSFVAGVDGIDSVKWQDDAALRTLLDGITTQGKQTKYSVSDDTLRVYLEDGAQGQDVITFVLDSGVGGGYTVKQYLPIDNANDDTTNIDILNLAIVATDKDGDDTVAPIKVNLKDGVESTIQDSTEALTETLDGDGSFTSSSVSGDTQLKPGSDGAQTTIALKNYDEVHGTEANQFKGWSSNGNDIEVTEADTTVTLTDKVTGEKVLELTYYPEDVGVFGDANFKAAGTYDVTQFRAIDQPEDNISQLQVTVTSRSTDDTPKTAQITINISDGTTPTIIANNDASLTETVDMAANTPANDSFTQMLDIDSGTDAVDTVIFDLADSSVYQLADLTSSGQELVVQSQDSSYSLFIKGTTTEVLNIAVNKANGDVTVEQYQPLDNPLSNDIVLTLNATVTDTDGDSASDSFELTLTDGMDPRIENIGSIKVNEYGIGHNNRGEFGSATMTLEPSSDNIEKFEIDTTAISVADKDGNPVSPLTSGNKLVQYEEISGGYRGFIENGNKKLTVFEVKIDSDYTSDDLGKVDFKLVRGIDHPDAGTDSLFLTLPVIASDFDGDSSPAQDLNVEIKDYFSDAKNVTINLVEGSSTSNNGYTVVNYKQGDRLDNLEIEVPVAQQGNFAFGDIDSPSSKFDLDTLGTGNGIAVLAKNSNDQWAEVGTLTLITKGSNVRVKFSAADSVDHLDGPLSTTFTMTAIDNDGDRDSSNLNLTIKDKAAKLIIDPVRGDEDTDIAVTIEIDLHDADGEEIQSLLLGNPPGGSFFYIDPNSGNEMEVSGRLSKDKLDVSGTDVLSIDNIFYRPDDHYSTDSNGFEVNAQVKVEREGHPVETRNGKIDIVVDGIADKPTMAASFEPEADGDEDSLIKLDFAFETVDQSDASAETITYELKFSDVNIVADHKLVKSNGDEITPDINGVYHFTSAGIDNVYLAAKGDFSGSVLVDVKATSHEPFTDSTNSSETTLTVDVAPIVDDITYQVERVRVNEDTEFKLKDHIQVNDLKDSDGSENRFVYIKDLPNGTIITQFNADGDNAVILDGEAHLIVDPDDYATATLIMLDDPAGESVADEVDLIVEYALIESGTTAIIPPKDSNADFDFKVEVKVVDTATYADGDVAYDSQSMGDDQTIAVDIKGIADAPMMAADSNDVWQVVTDNQGAISGIKTTTPIDENSSIMLDFSVFSGETGYDKSGPDGSETVTVVLYAESGNLADYKIEDTDGNEISLTYTGMKNGQAQYEADIGQADIKITPKTNNTEDIQLKAKIIVTENDGNELVTEKDIFIEVNPVISGFNDNFIVNSNDNNYTPLEDQVNNVKWYPGKLTDRESGGDHEFVSKLVISGNEAESNAELSDIALTIEANSAIAQVLIDGVATDLDAGKYRFDATNEVTIIAADGAELTAGNVEISALVTPEDSSADFVLNSTVSVTEVDVDSDSGFSKTVDYSGKLNVDIQPVVEDDGELNIIDDDDVGIAATQTNTAGSVSFTINKEAQGGSFVGSNADYSVNFIDLDADSTGAPNPETNQDERVSQVVIEFAGASQSVLDQLYVQGAINNGDGTWTVTNEDSFIVFAPNGVDETVTVKVHALVIDRGEDGEDSVNESEVSYAVRDSQSFQITFADPDPTGTVGGEAASASIDNTQAIKGTEDTKVRLDDTLREKLIFSELANLDDSSTNDQITIVFDVSNIPEIKRVTSGTGEENFVNGKYAFTIDAEDVNDDGSLKEGALGNAAITLIEDFAGDFTIPISVVITDMDSGDENVVTQQVNFEITPVVDGVTKDNGVVVQTVEAADFTAGEEAPNSIKANTAYEDSQVTLNLNRFSFKDEDTDLSQGVESFAAIEISSTVGAVTAGTVYSGVEEKQDGTLSITAAQLPNGVTVEQVLAEVVFTPSKDFSGKVTITLDGTIIDQTDNVGSVTAPFKQTFDIDVKSIVDGVTTQSLGDKVIDGSEDTPISLSVLDFTLDDSDGSEEFVSFKLTDVPQDFLVSSTSSDFAVSNNGSGVWSIKIAQSVGETVDLSDIQITPAENFSGSANIGYVVYTQEEADKQPKQQGGRITLNIAPEGDEIDTRIDQQATGAEHSGADTGLVDIKIDARILDKADSISAGAHSENSPETVYIKVENIPDGVSILLPEYTKGADLASGDYIAYQELDNGVYTGNWIVETNLQQVENIQLDLTGTDYNSDSWRGDNPQITLKVSSNDNGSIGPVAEQIVSLEITPDNDKPVVVAQTSYSVDEDVQLSITSIQIADADVIDDPGANMTVTISHTTGNLSFGTESIQYANDNNITIGSDSDGNIVLDGTIEAINKLLSGSEVTTDRGLLFIGDENSHVDSQIQVQVTDNGNNGDVNGDGTIDINDALTSDQITVDVKVNPISDKPTLEAERNRYLVAVNDAQLAVIPLLGLIPALAVADEKLSVQFDNVPAGTTIKVGGVTATLNGDGLFQADVPQGGDTDITIEVPAGITVSETAIEIRAVSTDGDADPALSDPVTINVTADSSESILGTAGNDYLFNLDDSDGITLSGDAGDDIIIGSDRADILEGGAGDDQILAGDGDDIVQGGLGSDILTGGGGQDIFVWTAEDIDLANPQVDKITDFNADKSVGAEKDMIDLSEVFESDDSMEDILSRLTAEKDGDKINIEILDQEGGETVQTIVLENQAGYTLDGGSASLMDDLISHEFIRLINQE